MKEMDARERREEEMEPAASKKFHGKKFMWDGTVYESRDMAEKALSSYFKDRFEGEIVVEDDRFLVYTRRVPTAQSGSV
jgi:hypothetical protein